MMQVRQSPSHFMARGFTFVETLIVMVALGIAAVSIANLSGKLFQGQSSSRDIIVGTQLMQQCAEQVMAIRRSTAASAGYDGVTNTKCDVLPLPAGYASATVNVQDLTPATAACPASVSGCKLLKIQQNGLKPISLLLVKE